MSLSAPPTAYTLYQGDCLAYLPTLPPASVDVVITDPPYGIGYASNWTTAANGLPRKSEASFGRDEFDPRWIPMVFNVQKEDSFLYCFTRWDVLYFWKAEFEHAGYKAVQRLIWDKAHWKMGDLRYYGSQVEDILLFRKGAPTMFLNGRGRRGNLNRYSSTWFPEGQYDHPTQKPEALIRIYVQDSTNPGGTVFDPFMGSGTTGVAAIQLGRRFIGCEIEARYFQIAKARLEQVSLQLPLFPVSRTSSPAAHPQEVMFPPDTHAAKAAKVERQP